MTKDRDMLEALAGFTHVAIAFGRDGGISVMNGMDERRLVLLGAIDALVIEVAQAARDEALKEGDPNSFAKGYAEGQGEDFIAAREQYLKELARNQKLAEKLVKADVRVAELEASHDGAKQLYAEASARENALRTAIRKAAPDQAAYIEGFAENIEKCVPEPEPAPVESEREKLENIPF
jgi:hypothetical protein